MATWRERAETLWRDFFEVDARALATLRICLGLLLLIDLVLTWESKAFNCKMSVWQDRQR